jgi:hypothetical protein
MKSCGLARVDKLAISFMKKERREAGGDHGREEDKKEKERHSLYHQPVFLFYVLFIYTLFVGFFNNFHVQKGFAWKGIRETLIYR